MRKIELSLFVYVYLEQSCSNVRWTFVAHRMHAEWREEKRKSGRMREGEQRDGESEGKDVKGEGEEGWNWK